MPGSIREQVAEILRLSAVLAKDVPGRVKRQVRVVVRSYKEKMRQMFPAEDESPSSEDDSDFDSSSEDSSGADSSDEEWLPSDASDSDAEEEPLLLGVLLPIGASAYQSPWYAAGTAWSRPGEYPFPHSSFHCPPATVLQLESWHAQLFDQRCNCVNSQLGGRCICDQLFAGWLTDEREAAADNTECRERCPNNEQRKRCYREVAKGLFEDLHGKRRRLPHCIVARIRAIWPAQTGLYMGFKMK